MLQLKESMMDIFKRILLGLIIVLLFGSIGLNIHYTISGLSDKVINQDVNPYEPADMGPGFLRYYL